MSLSGLAIAFGGPVVGALADGAGRRKPWLAAFTAAAVVAIAAMWFVRPDPSFVVLALVLATPLPWQRRSWALLWSFLAVNAFIVLRISFTLAAAGFAADKQYALFELGSLARGVLTRAENILSDNPTVSFVAPALIWFLLAFRHVLWSKTTADATATQQNNT